MLKTTGKFVFAVLSETVTAVAVSALPVTSPVISPTNAVDVMLVAPVTTPASITIAPSRTICCPPTGVIVKSVPAVLVIAFPFILILSIWSAVSVPNEVIFVCAAVVTVAAVPLVLPVTLPDKFPVTFPVSVPTNPVAVTLPVLGLYVSVPSDSRPKSPPSISPPAVKMMALLSL